MGEHKNKTMEPSKEQIEREVAAKYAMKRAALAEAFAINLCKNPGIVTGSSAAEGTIIKPSAMADWSVQMADALMERLYNRPIKDAE